tara:strand:- start:13140 stop:13550 length:411 start_codon:yes stop_codon:yes gene_type:complete
MGIRITRGAGLDIRLEKIAQKTTRQLRRVHRDGAYKMAEVAQQMAPVLSGDLEMSIHVQETVESGQRKVFTVVADGTPYAIYMHENVYELGTLSALKDQSGQFRVGRKFIDRSAQWLIRDWKFYEKARNAVKTGKK